MKIRSILPALALIALPFVPNASAGLLKTSLTLNLNILPGTPLEVTTQVSIPDVQALLDSLTDVTESPIKIVDSVGNVVGEVPIQDILDAVNQAVEDTVDGATDVVKDITVVVDDVTTPPSEVVTQIVNNTTMHVTNVVTKTASVGKANLPPSVRVLKKGVRALRAILRGTASDDWKVAKIELMVNRKLKVVRGTNSWNARPVLREGKNRIVVRAIDNAGMVSEPQRVTINVKP